MSLSAIEHSEIDLTGYRDQRIVTQLSSSLSSTGEKWSRFSCNEARHEKDVAYF